MDIPSKMNFSNNFMGGEGGNPWLAGWGGRTQTPGVAAPAPVNHTPVAVPRTPIPPPPLQQPGYGAPTGGMSLGDIINGPQFGAGQGAPGQMPTPAVQPSALPNPQNPQLNYKAYAANTMQNILHPQGGGA